MKRRLFTILSAVSLLLCLAAVVLWVRTLPYSIDNLYESDDGKVNVFTGLGRLVIKFRSDRVANLESAAAVSGFILLGTGWHKATRPDGEYEFAAYIGLLPLAVAAAVLPILWFRRWRRSRGRPRGFDVQSPTSQGNVQ